MDDWLNESSGADDLSVENAGESDFGASDLGPLDSGEMDPDPGQEKKPMPDMSEEQDPGLDDPYQPRVWPRQPHGWEYLPGYIDWSVWAKAESWGKGRKAAQADLAPDALETLDAQDPAPLNEEDNTPLPDLEQTPTPEPTPEPVAEPATEPVAETAPEATTETTTLPEEDTTEPPADQTGDRDAPEQADQIGTGQGLGGGGVGGGSIGGVSGERGKDGGDAPSGNDPEPKWYLPVRNGKITSRVGDPRPPSANGEPREHKGTDYQNEGHVDKTVYALSDGKVEQIDHDPQSGDKVVILLHNGDRVRYFHTDGKGTGLEKGDPVAGGQPIGEYNDSGHTTGKDGGKAQVAHVQIELNGQKDNVVDAEQYLREKKAVEPPHDILCGI